MKLFQKLLYVVVLALLFASCGGQGGHAAVEAVSDTTNLAEYYAGKHIGLLLGSAQEDFGRSYFTKSTIETMSDATTLLAALQARKLDAVLLNRDAVAPAMEKNPKLTIVRRDLTQVGVGFAFRKGENKLRTQFNQFLDELNATHEVDSIYALWNHHFDTAPVPVDGDGSAGTLRFGTTAIERPVSAVRNGKLVGSDVDLAYRFARKYGYKIKESRIDFGGLIPALVSGKLDFIANTIQINQTRAQSVDFSEPYLLQSCDLIALQEPAPAPRAEGEDGGWKIRSREDMAGKRIAVVPAMLYDEIARKEFPKSERIYTELATLPVALTTEKCDAILMERTTIPRLQQAHPQIAVALRDIADQQLAFGFNKKNRALRDQFNTFLEELKASGELNRIIQGWITDFDGMPMPEEGDGSGGTLRFGTTCEDAPVSAIRNGEPAGHNIDLVYRFAARHQMKVELSKMNFTGLITAIEGGRCDIVGDNIAITDERAKRMAFSIPFLEEPIDLITLKKNLPDESTATSSDGKYRSAADLAHARFGIMTGTVYDGIIRKNFPQAKRIYLDRASDMIMSLIAGKCDAIMMEHALVKVLEEQNPDVGTLVEAFQKQDLAFAFSKQSIELEKKFSDFIRELKASGEMNSLLEGWKNNFNGTPLPALTGDGSGGTLRFGCSLEGAPASAIRDGQAAGTNVDIVYRFANKYNMKVELMPLPFTAMLASVESGRCDIIGDNISVTEERKQRVLFSEPYDNDPIDILVLKKNMAASTPSTATSKMRTADDLNGRRIGVLMGAVYEEYAKKHYPKATIVYIDNKPDIVLSLENKRCDGAFFSSDVIPNILQQHPTLAVLQEKLEVHHVGFGVRKGNHPLLSQLNEFIQKETQSGELQRLNNDWINKPYEMPIPTVGGNGTAGLLRIGTTGVDVPASFVRDGALVGTDIAIIYHFATLYNYRVQIEKIPFGGLIAALTSGKIDVIASNLVINDERKQMIDQTEAYGTRDINMLARKADMAAYSDNDAQVGEASGFWESLKQSFESNLVQEKRYMLIVDGLWVTLIISVLAALLGTLLGAGICFLRMNRHPLFHNFAKGYITLVRGTPILVLLMIMYYVIFAKVNINAIPVAIFAFAMNFAAYVSEMFRTSIESIPGGQSEAGIAMGFTKAKTFLYIILPQAVRRVLPVYKGEFISLVKSTSIVGYIAVEDLTKASDIIRSRTFDAFFPLILVAVIYFFIAWAFTLLLDRLDAGTDPKRKLSKKKKS
ncbi:MAG: ABC transporter permease subunit [Prevotellaceae bacterium]|jgi:polar amino acid transport system substrate-binding protein|nr:ABC transporter permease subunit [Prevotellaceae bacterium]